MLTLKSCALHSRHPWSWSTSSQIFNIWSYVLHRRRLGWMARY